MTHIPAPDDSRDLADWLDGQVASGVLTQDEAEAIAADYRGPTDRDTPTRHHYDCEQPPARKRDAR